VRVLITGGRGQLGRALADALANDEVAAPGRDELDVTYEKRVRETILDFTPAVVIQAAAWTDTAACERDPDRAMLVNAEGAAHVARACRDTGSAMLYVSTNEVFDGQKRQPYHERDLPNPINVYGHSKLEGERRVQALLPHACIVRTSWLYGAGRDSFPERVLAQASLGGPLKLVTDEVASPTFTVDLARAIVRLVHVGAMGTYHLTNSGACSRFEWAEELLRVACLSVPIEAVTQADYGAPYRKPASSALANTRAARLGITLRPWQDALAEHMSRTSVRQEAPL
jgi:dTDP-4-dehydrorhamnose reductase